VSTATQNTITVSIREFSSSMPSVSGADLTADLSLKRSKITNLEKVAEIPFVTPTTPKNSAFGHSEMHAVDTVAWKGCTLIYVNVARTLGCDI
jgi:hypothetical protein